MRYDPTMYVLEGLRRQYSHYVDLAEIADRHHARRPSPETRLAAERARAAMAAADEMLKEALADAGWAERCFT